MKVYENDIQTEKALISWWKKNRYYVGITVLGVLMISSTFMNVKKYKETNSTQAATIYYYIVPGLLQGNSEIALKQAADLKENYPDSIYSVLSSLHVAKYYINNKDYDNSITQLNWAINHGNTYLRELAKSELARVYVEVNKTDEALKIVKSELKFRTQANMIAGDAYVKLKELKKAKESYKLALDNCDNEYQYDLCEIIKMKYNNLNYVESKKS
jgi:predicted negative regulator of RcsB-dependent stress response